METAYIFGHIGNLGNGLGKGWSIEDTFAWTVGYESQMTLPLPGNDKPYRLHCTLHPLINPAQRDSQRLVFLAGTEVLGRFEVKERRTIEFALPAHLTAGREKIILTLVHPDALRPADFQPTQDTRWLALCFHSAGLVQNDGEAGSIGHALPTGIIAGNQSALALARILAGLPSLRGKLRVQYIDTYPDLAETTARRPADTFSSAAFCWLQIGTGRPSTTQALTAALPPGCELKRFGVPEINALWPFLSADPRAIREPGLYVPARYRFGDRIAVAMTSYVMADDLLYMIYEGNAEKELPDLNALLAADVMNWRRMDARCDIKMAEAMRAVVREQRLFVAPTIAGPALLRMLAERLVHTSALNDIAEGADLSADLDALMEGYVGRPEELPIFPNVARGLNLAWWREDQTYRWHGNRLTFKDYVLDYTRWVAWRP